MYLCRTKGQAIPGLHEVPDVQQVLTDGFGPHITPRETKTPLELALPGVITDHSTYVFGI